MIQNIVKNLGSLPKLFIIYIFLFSFLPVEAFSQNLMSGTLLLNNPSPYVSDWESNSNMAILTVINSKRTMRANVEVMLKKDGTNISSVLTGNITQIPGPLQQGVPVTSVYRSDNIASWGNLSLTGEIGESVIRTGRLPEGTYEVCINITETDPPQNPPATLLICSNFHISEIQAPRLIAPQNGSNVMIKNPVFQWTPITGIRGIKYKIKIVEVLSNQSPELAINNLAFYESNLNTASLRYPISSSSFIKGSTYAWQVQAIGINGNGIGSNNGLSEVFSFKFIGGAILIDSINSIPLPKILVASNFRIVVQGWDRPSKSSNPQLPSGKGYIKFSCSMNHIPVFFTDVSWTGINEEVNLTGGYAYYSSSKQTPVGPIAIRLIPGFNLLIDSMFITKTDCQFTGSLLLPNSINNGSCKSSKLQLPLTSITPLCEFYKDVDASFDNFSIGETDIQIKGNGYVIDFSSSQSLSGTAPPLINAWKGVVLKNGETFTEGSDSIINNRGYIKAKYTFTNCLITATGLSGKLMLQNSFAFYSLEPFGYKIELPSSSSSFLTLNSSAISNGQFVNAIVDIPEKAMRTTSQLKVRSKPLTLTVQPDMDLIGNARISESIEWGEFSKTQGTPEFYQLLNESGGELTGKFYLAARYMNPYYPINSPETTDPLDEGSFKPPALTTISLDNQLEEKQMQGITFYPIDANSKKFVIKTKDLLQADTANGLILENATITGWINVIRTGVNSELNIFPRIEKIDDLGATWSDQYKGIEAFKSSNKFKDSLLIKKIQFVESATWDADFNGKIKFEAGIKNDLNYKNMVYTSTANNAGGKVIISIPQEMDYWGVELVPKDPIQSAGLICVKRGVVYLTAAGFYEPKHFALPFYLTWGEIKATGDLGRLIFDYNNTGQKFDNFYYAPSTLELSKVVSQDSGFVQTFGSLSIGFFGGKMMSISDYKSQIRGSPFDGRNVIIHTEAFMEGGASELHWYRSWGGGTADLDFNMRYDSVSQNGFVGSGISVLSGLGGNFRSEVRTTSVSTCFKFINEFTAEHYFEFLTTRFGAMGNVWGCGCIVGDELEQIVVGGELSASSGTESSILARGGALVTMIYSYKPTRIMLELNGDMYLVIAHTNMEVTALAEFTIDRDAEYVKAYLRGSYKTSNFLSGILGEGEIDWQIGSSYFSIQGRLLVEIYSFGGGKSIEGGIYIGVNAPKEKAWVMQGIDGSFGLDVTSLQPELTGFYAYVSKTEAKSILIFSGGYQLYVGLGAFISGVNDPSFTLVGNVGLRIWGEFVGGLLSASLSANLQLLVGLPNPGFRGELGVEACCCWGIYCDSYTIICGFNRERSFYFDN